MQPRRKLTLQLTATARGSDPLAQASVFDDAQRWHRLDAEALGEVRVALHGDAYQFERVVVASVLQHLGDESLHAAAAT